MRYLRASKRKDWRRTVAAMALVAVLVGTIGLACSPPNNLGGEAFYGDVGKVADPLDGYSIETKEWTSGGNYAEELRTEAKAVAWLEKWGTRLHVIAIERRYYESTGTLHALYVHYQRLE